jgi:hypothetical protein
MRETVRHPGFYTTTKKEGSQVKIKRKKKVIIEATFRS